MKTKKIQLLIYTFVILSYISSCLREKQYFIWNFSWQEILSFIIGVALVIFLVRIASNLTTTKELTINSETEEDVIIEKPKTKMITDSITVSNTRTGKETVYESDNELGLRWDWKGDNVFLQIYQITNGEGEGRILAILRDYSIIKFEIEEITL